MPVVSRVNVVKRLKRLLAQVVFVGGITPCVPGLVILQRDGVLVMYQSFESAQADAPGLVERGA